ncbi:FCD domain protein [uncultured Pleomorphomonas sp.]|uniref:HTH gntR-type domain-containing protein n=2 Tax=Pleomorphomonas TaxID=261933 RepID=A0A2G9WXM0_9HYPH|nr:FadR/GntR family transcriptional regulator [Pleomorphomonas carboxyditropha]PIO99424.1 hypothetical protein CJ014_08880 [Pleomorphomonas carboxyditropha]SCM76533.1 FCD domain protein [uncultured Pleomorphomonas sp.]
MRKSLTDELTASLTTQIETGKFSLGEKLPTGQRLAEEHGVSVTVVREAISRLMSEGLVVSRQGAGVFVAPSIDRRPFRIMRSNGADAPTLSEVFELRLGVEVEAAALAATRHNKRTLAAISRALKEMQAAYEAGGDAVEEDLAFHRKIALATGNALFGGFIEFIGGHVKGVIQASRESGDRDEIVAALAEHNLIYSAIAAGDANGAREAMKQHMDRCLSRCG